jgi:pimeloyl-ACP methyl ester carboxylesterase
MPTTTHIADLGGSRLHWRVNGERSELPDIVLDHGGGGSADDWSHVVPILAAQGRVYSYDRAGMGDSPSDGLGCGAPAVSARLAKLIEHAGVRKPFILAGYSLGGLYARHYAQLHPQDVAGLVLVDTTPTALEIPQALIRRAMRMVWLIHWVARSGLGLLVWRMTGRKTDVEKFKRVVALVGAPGYVQRMREETGAIAGIQAEVARVAPQLRHPTLAVIAGVGRKNMSAEEFARVRSLHEQLAQSAPAPLSRLAVVEAANHGTLVSDPRHAAELAAHIMNFARSINQDPTA